MNAPRRWIDAALLTAVLPLVGLLVVVIAVLDWWTRNPAAAPTPPRKPCEPPQPPPFC